MDKNNKEILTPKQIKERFVKSSERDKFKKIEVSESQSVILSNKLLSEETTYEGNIKLNNVEYLFSLSFQYTSSENENIFLLILKIDRIQLGFADTISIIDLLKTPKISFLFEDDEVLVYDQIFFYNDCKVTETGTKEEVFFKCDQGFIEKIVNSKTLDYRVENGNNILSEDKFTYSDILIITGFYNYFFDKDFKLSEISEFYHLERIKEEKEEKEYLEKTQKKIEESKKRIAELDKSIEKQMKELDSSCFVVTATMGNNKHPIVEDFRFYRDTKLSINFFGRIFINFYYMIGPYIAELIKKNDYLKKITFKFLISPIHTYLNNKNKFKY